jgi:hyaluronate lyase
MFEFGTNYRAGSGRRILNIWLAVALVFCLIPPSDARAADEYDGLRAKLADKLTGGSSYDPLDPDIASRIGSIDTSAQTSWDSMDKSSGRTYLWADSASSAISADITRSYSRLKSMAIAYRTAGGALEGNAALLSDMKSALEWLYDNRFNETVTRYDNWWDWEIGVPAALNDTVVLLYDELASSAITDYMNAVEAFSPDPTLLRGDTVSTSSNRVWKANIVAVRGIIVKDGTKIASARDALSDVFDYVDKGPGFYRDGSYIFHDYIPYNGGYGRSLLATLTGMVRLLDGSTWEVTDPDLSHIYQWVYDSYEPLIYKGGMMSMVSGREASREQLQEHVSGQQLIGTIIELSQFAPPSDALAFKQMAKYWLQEDTTRNFYGDAPIYLIVWTKELMNDTAIVPRGELVKHHRYPAMDRLVHLRPGFGFGVSMHSTRVHNFETMHNENLRAHHTSDGMTYLYNNDLTQFSDNFWPTVNAFRLPGTTVLKDSVSLTRRFSDQAWVGGSDIAGLYGVSGMSLHPYNQNLSAKKSWFMFDDEVVALGSDIRSTDGIAVETIVENRKLNGSGSNAFIVDGAAKPSATGWSETMSNTSWAHLAGNVAGSDIGYYFPGTAAVHALRESRTDSWTSINDRPVTSAAMHTNNFLNLWFNHGTNPSGEKYEYVLLPNKTAVQTGDYAAAPDIVVLENTSDVHAVKETGLGIVAANFWNDGVKSVDLITTNRRASVMTHETSGDIEIAVSDPTQLNDGYIELSIARSATGLISADPGITVVQYHPYIKLRADVNGTMGQSLRAKFNLTGTPVPNPVPPGPPAAQDVIIVDNKDKGFASDTAWRSLSNVAGYYGEDYLTDNTSSADPGKWAMWTPYIGKSGNYALYMQWAVASNRPAAAPLEIKDADGIDTYKTVNQKQNGGQWVFIGNYDMEAGTSNTIKILSTNPGYTIADAVKLEYQLVGEAEKLPAVASGAALSQHLDSKASNNLWQKLNATAVSDYVEYEYDVPAPGTYQIQLHAKTNNTRAKFKLYLPQENVYVGTEKDQYASVDGYETFDMGQHTFGSAGTKRFRFIVTGKHASSSGYTLGNDYIKLTAQ